MKAFLEYLFELHNIDKLKLKPHICWGDDNRYWIINYLKPLEMPLGYSKDNSFKKITRPNDLNIFLSCFSTCKKNYKVIRFI